MDDDHLPIDDYADTIVDAIAAHRVVIIHGETGCGKSSRVPCILDAAARRAGSHPVKMMVSQPRRIAVRMLAERLRSSAQLGQAVGYRMGHGARDEGRATRVWFVTSGYLCRLLAHHASSFDGHTHLVIDEVHERSIDTGALQPRPQPKPKPSLDHSPRPFSTPTHLLTDT
ncbi:P-loop containing nucleoside triphosphate hydrolase protein [Pavlovales sp. CCMP2436]|nr:P-loop containing nucleoside triphosphate hydrolase protein [Pavlovales sp. CCMP2436]